MQKKKYTYDYPDQREISKGLQLGDFLIISKKTKSSPNMVSLMCSGKRKMKKDVKNAIEQLIELNKQKENISIEQ